MVDAPACITLCDRQYVCVCDMHRANPVFAHIHYRNLVLAAVRQNGDALRLASPALQADIDVVLPAMQQLRERMLNAKQNYDAESICEFFKQYVQLQSANAKNSDATYEEGCGLLRVNTSSLESNASDPIDYRSTFEEACKCATSTFNSRQFGYTLPVSDARILGNIRHPFYGTLMFKFMRYINNGGVSVIEIVPHDYPHYRKLVLAAVKQNGRALAYASEELKADRKVVLAAVKQGGWALQFASEDMRGDSDVVLAAVRNYGYALDYASDELRADPDVRRAAGRRYSL